MRHTQFRRSLMQNTVLLVTGLFWWIALAPFARLIPRDPVLSVAYGRDGGKFIDNCKHLFCAAARHDASRNIVYVARDLSTARQIRSHGGRAVVRGTLEEFRLWVRAGTIFADSVDWTEGYRYAASRGARVVQMWHGIPLKLVQMARVESRGSRPFLVEAAYRLHLRSTGRTKRLDWFVSTSHVVTERAFRRSFNFARVSHAGYPRNDALFDIEDPLRLVNTDDRARMSAIRHRAQGGKVAVYAPTFRERLNDPFADGSVDLASLSSTAVELNLLLLIKLHPWMHGRIESADMPGLIFVKPDSDLYPLLPLADFLATDYSSVFFDYLLLDRPVLFFPYDLEHYLSGERAMYFDYYEMTPGPKASSTQELVSAIKDVAAGKDDWRDARARVRELVFQHQDGKAAQRLIDELFPPTASHSS